MSEPIFLTLATNRDDKGQTENYRVYNGGGQVAVKNKRGEQVTKNAIVGGNGTIYIANPLAEDTDEWVLMTRAAYDALRGDFSTKAARDAKKAPAKGRK